MRRFSTAALAALIALSVLGPSTSVKAASGRKARVVVAVIDSGINVFHEYFHAGGPLYGNNAPSSVTPDVLEEFGIGKQQIIKVPRTGNFQADYKKVESRFAKIEKGKPYWFQGTNIIGISFLNEGPRLRPDGTESTHGIGTAAAVLTANPEAIVVVVEDISEASEEWAFTHPAVDIITTSYGPVTSVPTLNHLSNSYTGVVENGKVHFGAAANDPTYSTFDQTSGPWWSIGVAGFEEGDSGGRQLLSGNVPDFIGDFTQDLPYCRSCEEGTRPVSGTSFATPRSAGTFSAALLEARRRLGHSGGIVKTEEGPSLIGGPEPITNWEMRRALEIAAPYPTFADYGQTPDPTAVPMIDAAPWTQAGWGLITPERRYDVVAETLAHLGLGSKPKTSKPQQACDFMTANMEVRHLYWDNVAVFGQGFGKSKDPYIYC